MAGMAHRYCCRVSHRPALVSRSLVASTRTILMKRTKLSCGSEGGRHLEAAPQKGGEQGHWDPRPCPSFLCHCLSRWLLGPSVSPSGLGWGSAASQALGL